VTTALMGYYEGDELRLNYIASLAPSQLEARVYYLTPTRPDGPPFVDTIPATTTFTADRTPQFIEADVGAGGSCNIVGGGVSIPSPLETVIKRGQFYVRFVIRRQASGFEDCLCCGYIYSTKPFLSIGEHIEPGPGGGEGSLSWVSLAADIAPVDVTSVLAAANAYRRIHGFVWYYNCAAVVASRTLVTTLRRAGLAVPTGFAGAGIHWTNSGVTLTTGEEGIVYSRDKITSENDNGTLTTASTATLPNPFPYDAVEDDLAELFFDVGAADAGDRHSIYLLQEEWLKI